MSIIIFFDMYCCTSGGISPVINKYSSPVNVLRVYSPNLEHWLYTDVLLQIVAGLHSSFIAKLISTSFNK